MTWQRHIVDRYEDPSSDFKSSMATGTSQPDASESSTVLEYSREVLGLGLLILDLKVAVREREREMVIC